jgi:hypothetical protein
MPSRRHRRRHRPLTTSGRQFLPRRMKSSFSNSSMAASSNKKLVESWLKGRGIYKVPVSFFHPPSRFMAPQKKNQASTAGSLSSRTSAPAPKPKPAAKAHKPVEAVLKPVKRLKTALSTSSFASSQADSNDVPDNISNDSSTPDIVDIVSDAEGDPADEETPEEQLSTYPLRESAPSLLIFFPQRRHRRLGVPRSTFSSSPTSPFATRVLACIISSLAPPATVNQTRVVAGVFKTRLTEPRHPISKPTRLAASAPRP